MEKSKTVLSKAVGSASADLDSAARLDLGSELRIERVLAERARRAHLPLTNLVLERER